MDRSKVILHRGAVLVKLMSDVISYSDEGGASEVATRVHEGCRTNERITCCSDMVIGMLLNWIEIELNSIHLGVWSTRLRDKALAVDCYHWSTDRAIPHMWVDMLSRIERKTTTFDTFPSSLSSKHGHCNRTVVVSSPGQCLSETMENAKLCIHRTKRLSWSSAREMRHRACCSDAGCHAYQKEFSRRASNSRPRHYSRTMVHCHISTMRWPTAPLEMNTVRMTTRVAQLCVVFSFPN